jgi:hypothetical protein
MDMINQILERRRSLKASFAVSTGLTGMILFPKTGFSNPVDPDGSLTVIGHERTVGN